MTLNLVRALQDAGFRSTLVVTRAGGALRDAVADDVEIVVLNRPGTLAAFWSLVRFLRARRPDVLISAHGHNNIVALWARAVARVPTKVIVQQHNVMSAQARAGDGWRFTILPWLYRLFVGWADAVVSVSAGAADDMAKTTGLARDRIRVIPNPVIGSNIDALIAEPVTHPFFAPGGLPVFLTAGRFVEVKGLDIAVEAFARVHALRPSRLLMVGDGPLRPVIEARVRELGLGDAVAFPGFVANPVSLMSHAAALVLPSRHEGFGAVIVEALAAGCPVISTDCPFGPAEILDNGRFGMLTPVDDAAAMADAMLLTLDAPREPARLRARADEYTAAYVASRYSDLFDTL